MTVLLALVLAVRVWGQSAGTPCQSPEELRARFPAHALDCRDCNVLILDLDGLRADRLGYAPFISSLAKRGLVFRNAMAQSSWTYPSVASVATSRYPSEHGVGFTAAVLNRSLPTLFSVLQEKGYRTFGDDRRPFVWREKMIMDVPENSFDSPAYAARLNAVLDGMSRSRSLAYVINLDLHRPYARQPPSGKAAMDPDTALYLKYSKEHGRDHVQRPSQEVIAAVNRVYDRRVAYVDGKVKELFAALQRKGLSQRTIVVIYANHGELIFEHSLWGHGFGYYDPEIHVPLIVLHPRVDQRSAAALCEQVELIDVAPTLLEMLGVAAPGFGEGKSLVPLISGLADDRSFEYAFSARANLSDQSEKMVRTRRWKLLAAPDGSCQLFDLAADPGETRDVHAKHPDVVKELKIALSRWEKKKQLLRQPSSYDQSEAEKKELIRLGYW